MVKISVRDQMIIIDCLMLAAELSATKEKRISCLALAALATMVLIADTYAKAKESNPRACDAVVLSNLSPIFKVALLLSIPQINLNFVLID